MAEPSVKSDGSGGYTFSWDHCVNSPHMEVKGSVSSDGKYSVRFYKHGTGSFGYTYNIKVNGTSIFSYGVGDIKENVNIPVKYVGLGEKMEDLIPFDIENYIYGLFKDMV